MTQPEPTCPRCGETRQIEVQQKGWFWCAVCCCPFRPRDEKPLETFEK